MYKNHFLLLLLILLIGFILRTIKVGEVPPSLYWDEVSLGYNAYSLMQTGRDEYGEFLPVVLRSFGDYKPALYAYLIIPFAYIFGLGALAIRFPSIIIGSLGIIGTFLLVRELFTYNQKDSRYGYGLVIAYIASFLIAISPWHIQFSRAAFEANVGLTISIFVTYFFLKSFTKSYLLLLVAFLSGLNAYVYQGERMFTPLLLVILCLVYWKKIYSFPKRYVITSIFLFIILLLPLVIYAFHNPDTFSRAKTVNIFSSQKIYSERELARKVYAKERGDILGLAFNNKYIVYGKSFINNYLLHFDPNWLFITGDRNDRHHAFRMGLFYLFELLFLLIGIYALIFGSYSRTTQLFILLWLLISLLPSTLAVDAPNSLRAIHFFFILEIIIAMGIHFVIYYVWKKRLKVLTYSFRLVVPIVVVISLLAALNIFYFLNQYFIQYPYYTAEEWQYGYKEAVTELEKVKHNYKEIIVSNDIPLDQSYIFFLFYTKYPPKLYQNNPTRYSSVKIIGKYTFRDVDLMAERKSTNKLFLVHGTASYQPGMRVVRIIRHPSGKPAMQIIEGKEGL